MSVKISANGNNIAYLKNGTIIFSGPIKKKNLIPINLNKNIIDIALGLNFIICLTNENKVIGFGTINNQPIVIPTDLNNVINIYAGYNHWVVLKNNGSILGYGDNSKEQIKFTSNFAVNLNYYRIVVKYNVTCVYNYDNQKYYLYVFGTDNDNIKITSIKTIPNNNILNLISIGYNYIIATNTINSDKFYKWVNNNLNPTIIDLTSINNKPILNILSTDLYDIFVCNFIGKVSLNIICKIGTVINLNNIHSINFTKTIQTRLSSGENKNYDTYTTIINYSDFINIITSNNYFIFLKDDDTIKIIGDNIDKTTDNFTIINGACRTNNTLTEYPPWKQILNTKYDLCASESLKDWYSSGFAFDTKTNQCQIFNKSSYTNASKNYINQSPLKYGLQFSGNSWTCYVKNRNVSLEIDLLFQKHGFVNRGLWKDCRLLCSTNMSNRTIAVNFEDLTKKNFKNESDVYLYVLNKCIEQKYDTFAFQAGYALFIGNFEKFNVDSSSKLLETADNSCKFYYSKHGKSDLDNNEYPFGADCVNRVYSTKNENGLIDTLPNMNNEIDNLLSINGFKDKGLWIGRKNNVTSFYKYDDTTVDIRTLDIKNIIDLYNYIINECNTNNYNTFAFENSYLLYFGNIDETIIGTGYTYYSKVGKSNLNVEDYPYGGNNIVRVYSKREPNGMINYSSEITTTSADKSRNLGPLINRNLDLWIDRANTMDLSNRTFPNSINQSQLNGLYYDLDYIPGSNTYQPQPYAGIGIPINFFSNIENLRNIDNKIIKISLFIILIIILILFLLKNMQIINFS